MLKQPKNTKKGVKIMRYFLHAVEVKTGFIFEKEIFSKEEAERLEKELSNEGYHDFYLEEGWSNLDEMYAYIAEKTSQAK
jgi:hypothetical protein